MTYATVRVIGVPFSADKPYAYHVPAHLEKEVHEGSIVVVPFGGANRVMTAFIQRLTDTCEYPVTKPVLGVPGKYLHISAELSELCLYLSGHLLCSVGDAVRCVLPAGLGVHKTYFYRCVPEAEDRVAEGAVNVEAADVFAHIREEGRVSERNLSKNMGEKAVTAANALVKLGMCVRELDYECTVNTGIEKVAYIPSGPSPFDGEPEGGGIRLTPKQRQVYETLIAAEGTLAVKELASSAKVSMSVVNEVAAKGLIRIEGIELDRSVKALITAAEKSYSGDFSLTEEQTAALDTLDGLYRDEQPRAALLWGVTGSGKTNVMLKLIDKVLESGKNVIMLVPEIALTAQTVGRFAARYRKNGIALLHSGLSAGERVDAWKRIDRGEVRIVIGTRSAVFAPLENVGLIIIDEEHDASFKSDSSPRYHARDAAKFRVAWSRGLLLLASATPSVESFYYAETGKYTLVTLNKRYGNARLPAVELYDLRTESPYVMPADEFDASVPPDKEMTAVEEIMDSVEEYSALPNDLIPEKGTVPLMLGERLKASLGETLSRGEQAILFINRRGYRTLAECRMCGYVFECPSCSVAMTHHYNRRCNQGYMVCHYCGHTEQVPRVCPRCGKCRISFIGSGTQLLEETLAKEFPTARVLRMDADTTHTKGAHEKILGAFRAGEADILVGTQMVAKGHDFPNVTLVGVILADTSLFVGDFRANEKTFSLLTQILGRAGRAEKPGHAVIQTYAPDNEVLTLASKQDYATFYAHEIEFRKTSVFPPFCDIISVLFASEIEADVTRGVKLFTGLIEQHLTQSFSDVKFILYGPVRHEIYRLAGKYRMRCLLKCRATPRMRALLAATLRDCIPAANNVTITADFNPMT